MLKIEIACEVVSAGAQRQERRIKPGFKGDVGTNRWRAAAADGEPDALRRDVEPVGIDAHHLEHDAVSALALFPRLDETSDARAVEWTIDNRMNDQCAAQRRDREAGHGGSHQNCRRKRQWAPACQISRESHGGGKQ